MKNIVLIGLPGSGKTTCGKKLAHKLNREFIDLDKLIEKNAGETIESIFKRLGEKAFRNMETLAATEAAATQGTIIAAGGGTVLNEENMKTLSQSGIVVFLNRPAKKIVENIHTDSRPLLQNDPQRIFTLHEERFGLYKKYNDIEISNTGTIAKTLSELERIAMLITESQKKFAVIGNPIAHSLSPNIHLPILDNFYDNTSYIRVAVTENELESWIKRVKCENFAGFNITMPHKRNIIPFLDNIDEEALQLNSVNTVTNRNGILTGYNTDGEGFKLALAAKEESFTNRNVVLLGSGGAAGTIALKAAKEGAKKITMLALHEEEAEAILEKAATLSNGIALNYSSFTPGNLLKSCKGTDILINATPLGMMGMKEDFTDFTFLTALPPKSLVCDLIYSPAHTNLIIEAQRLGLNTLGGIQMLIYQAILADNLFLDIRQNMLKAYDTIIKNIKGKVDLS